MRLCAMLRVRINRRPRLGGRVTSSDEAIILVPRQLAVPSGVKGGSAGQRGFAGALCTMVADLTLCPRSRLFSR